MIVFLFEDVASEYSSSILRAADSSCEISSANFVESVFGTYSEYMIDETLHKVTRGSASYIL